MPATANITPTADLYINGVLSGTKWAVNTLTFSFPIDPTYYGANYGSGEATNGFKAFTAIQQNAVRSILAEYASIINFTFTEKTETATQHADLRFAESNTPPTAWAYLPTTADIGGDAWFSNSTHWYDYAGRRQLRLVHHDARDRPYDGAQASADQLWNVWHDAGRSRFGRIHRDELSLLYRRGTDRAYERRLRLSADLDDVRRRWRCRKCTARTTRPTAATRSTSGIR